MTMFGFVVATTLVNLLYMFDLYFTKFQERKSLWGAAMVKMKNERIVYNVIPLYTLVCLWMIAFIFGNSITQLQIILSTLFWAWMFSLYLYTTYHFIKDNGKAEKE